MRVVNRIAALLLGLLLIAAGVLVVAETVLYLLDRPPWLPLESWRDRLSSTQLSHSTVLTVSIIALAVGLLIILAEVRPLRPQRLRTTPLAAPGAAGTAPPGPAAAVRPAAPTTPAERPLAAEQPSGAPLAGQPTGATPAEQPTGATPAEQPSAATPAGDGHADWWLTRRSVERRAVRAAGRVWGVHDIKARASGKPGRWRLAVNATGPRDGDPAEVEHAVRDELAALAAPTDVPVSTRLRRGHRRVE
jgi:hypothetical protein